MDENSPSFLQNLFKKNKDVEMMDFDQKADRIMGAVGTTLKEITLLRKSLESHRSKNKKIDSILSTIEKTESLSKKFLTPGGDEFGEKDVRKMVELYDKIEDSLIKNEKTKVEDKTLRNIIEDYRSEENERASFNASLSNKLTKISSRIGTSAKEFLVGNARALSIRGDDKKNVGIAAISSVSPIAGLLSKVVTDAIDLEPLFDNTKRFMSDMFKSGKDAIFGGKKGKIAKKGDGSEIIKSTLDVQYEEKEEIEQKRHKELIESINKGSKKGGGLFGGDGGVGFFGKGIGKTLKNIGKLAGAAAGGYAMYDAYTGIKDRKGESLFGTGEGEKGFMGSRAMRYGEGTLGGATTGASIGSMFGPAGTLAGALIGGLVGAATTAWADIDEDMKQKIKDTFYSIGAYIKDLFLGVVDKILHPIKTIKEVYAANKRIASKAWGSIKTATSSMFSQKAPSYMNRAMSDLGISKEQAAGIFGNLGHESGGLVGNAQEKDPTIKGSKGGLGWGQWTGDRRKNFEAFAKSNNLNAASDEANYRFLIHELNTSEKGSLDAIKKSKTAEEATIAFEQNYERAGVKHYDSRMSYAKAALDAMNGATVSNGNNLSTPLGSPSMSSISHESSNAKLENIQKLLATSKQSTPVNSTQSSSSSLQRMVDMKKDQVSRRSSGGMTSSNNLSPDTYLSGLQLGTT